jgi:hypothetical protein
MGAGADEAAGAAALDPWADFIAHLIDLDQRRQLQLLDARALSWLEVEGLVALEVERRRQWAEMVTHGPRG